MATGLRGEPNRSAKKENQQEEPKKEKTPASIEGKLILAGGKDSSLTLRMTVLVVR